MIALKINTFVSIGMGLVVEGQPNSQRVIINIFTRPASSVILHGVS